MKLEAATLQLSASDLAGHLGCAHLTELSRLVAEGKLQSPAWRPPMLDVLAQRGLAHEKAYVEHLSAQGKQVVSIEPAGDVAPEAVRKTRDAMGEGAEVIAQAALASGRWRGRADVLLRVPSRSAESVWSWSYEVVDTKLASETRAGTVLQLCLYSELLAEIQGVLPDYMYVVSPEAYADPERFRTLDFLAYHRSVKASLETSVAGALADPPVTYPEPVAQCDICKWWPQCDQRRRDDDHVSLVAGVTRLQRRELRSLDIETLTALASAPVPLSPRPERGAPETYERIAHQARVQLESRGLAVPRFETLDLAGGRGFALLPVPSPGDVFLDFEGDPFVAGGGREYLFGWVEIDAASGSPRYTGHWALDAATERKELERFVDHVEARIATHPDLHIYHFGVYEPGTIKRLMGRYATREDEIDGWLRAGRFVDLHAVVRQALRVGVESYSLKDLEVLHGFARELDLREASAQRRAVERALELGAAEAIEEGTRAAVESYNRDDCLSALSLRDWLEERRAEAAAQSGTEIARPTPGAAEPSEKLDERLKRLQPLIARLVAGVPDDVAERSREQQACWLLANLLDWHRREDKASWWEYFRLTRLSDEELCEEKDGLSGLEFVGRVGGRNKTPVHRYRFAEQEHGVGPGDTVHCGERKLGTIEAIDDLARTVDIKKRGDAADAHPTAIFAWERIGPDPKPSALERLAMWVAEHGIDAPGPRRAARDLLLRLPPRLAADAGPLVEEGEDLRDRVRRLAVGLNESVLAVQGPPGAGKTYLGARMICALVRAGLRVGVTAVSHKVIRNLLDAALEAAREEGIELRCIQKPGEVGTAALPSGLIETDDNAALLAAITTGTAGVAGATAWAWAREDFENVLDVLIVDEAGQMSLADTLAAAPAARSLVLLGDPQQLEQPIKGSHPDGCAASALEHLLGGHETMPPEKGLFLEETWRLHPSICDFTSEVFYEGRLRPHGDRDRQRLVGNTPFAGAGLWHVPVKHEGRQSGAVEEVEVVASIFERLLDGTVSWTDADGVESGLASDDLLIVAPYNLQVTALTKRLPHARIGTVDKFQGQEAPVVIYSMTTSSPEDAPRGMEFLYSLNRLNVATSRARCAVILVASPRLFAAECRTPRQMRLSNALCRFGELAEIIELPLTPSVLQG